ncbi:MAG: YceH family protein [Thermodesulfobacteriota bacterium]
MLDFELNAVEARVLGCLLEKEMATPEYYPLSLNGLLNACNQKSNREPVVNYDEHAVAQALESLKEKRLVWRTDAARVPKYGQEADRKFSLEKRELAVLCLLLLRGPQTVGELRGRSERLYGFADLEEVGVTLEGLTEMGLIRKLPRQPGRKESRYAHLLAGEPENVEPAAAAPEAAVLQVRAENERLAALEQEVDALRSELAELRSAFLEFKSQFD